MAAPVYATGDVPSASAVNQWFVNVTAAYKTATESVTSSTTLQDDDDLHVTVDASTVYDVSLVMFYDAATAGDIKVGFTYPASATGTFIATGIDPAGSSSAGDVTASADIATAFNFGGIGTGTTVAAHIKGLLTVAGTAGTLQVQWAQVSSSGTATRVFADSYLTLRRIA